MNPFDKAVQDGGGLGWPLIRSKDVKKITRPIEKAIVEPFKIVGSWTEDTIKNVYETQSKFFTAVVQGKPSEAGQALVDGVKESYDILEDHVKDANHVRLEIQRDTLEFLGSDLGKVLAVIAIVVACAFGAGPIILAGLKQAMLAAKAGAQFAIKAGAKYLAKQLTVKGLAKQAVKQGVKKLVKKEIKDYMTEKQKKEIAEYNARVEAEENKLIEEYSRQLEAEMKAEYEKLYGIPFDAAIDTKTTAKQPNTPDGLPIPPGFKPTNMTMPVYRSPSHRMSEAESREHYYKWDTQQRQRIIGQYKNEKAAYLKANPKVAAVYAAMLDGGLIAPDDKITAAAAQYDGDIQEKLNAALDLAIEQAEAVATSPEVVETSRRLREQGYTEAEIQKIWSQSDTYRDTMKIINYSTALPAATEFVKAKYGDHPKAGAAAVLIANEASEIETNKAVKSGNALPLFVGGGILLALMG